VMKKSLYTWSLYCNGQMHRDFLNTLYISVKHTFIIICEIWNYVNV
jgi:hypothetical protein